MGRTPSSFNAPECVQSTATGPSENDPKEPNPIPSGFEEMHLKDVSFRLLYSPRENERKIKVN